MSKDFLMGEYIRRKVTTEIREFGCWLAVTPNIEIERKHLDVLSECLSEYLKVGVRIKVPYHHIASYQRPRTWWDHTKERWFPEWFRRRFPVEYEKVDLGQIFDVAVPHAASVFVLLKEDGSVVRPYLKDMGHCTMCNGPVPVFKNNGDVSLNPQIVKT